MKRDYLKLAGLLLAATFASCTEEENMLGLQNGQVQVTVEKGGLSRTTLGDDSKTVTWCADDQIYLFDSDGASKGVLNLKEGAGQTTATFSGKVTGSLSKIDKALYPVPAVESGEYTYSFPAERTWTNESDAPMIGELSNNHVAFRNLAAMVRIDLQGYTYNEDSKLVLTMNGPYISGTAVVDIESETLAIADGGNSLTVTGIGSNVRFIDLPVPAGEYTGYVVTLNGVKLAESSEAKTLTKDNVAILGQTKSELTPNEDGVYEIRTAADMFWLAEQVNAGNAFNGKTFKLMNDINMSLKPWTPIGVVPAGSSTNNFGGTFDGGGYTLSGLKVNGGDAGLFGRTSGATIKNLTIDNSEFTGSNWAGCLVAYVSYSLTLENVKATSSIAVEEGETYENRLLGSGRKQANITMDGAQFITTVAELQAKVDGTDSEINVVLGCDLAGDVTVTQKPNVAVTIDGAGYKYAGVILVDGRSERYETAALTIKNIEFEAEGISAGAYINLGKEGDINNTKYTNHVTVDNCTFTYAGDEDVVAIKSYTGGDWNLSLGGCIVNEGMHSFVQLVNVEKGLKIYGCKVYSESGANLNNTPSLTINNCDFDVRGYAIRVGVNGIVEGKEKIFEIENSVLKSACENDDAVIVFRDNAKECTLKLANTTVDGTDKYSGNTDATTIIIDGAVYVASTDALSSVLTAGYTNVLLADGTYTIPSAVQNRTVKIVGSSKENTQIDATNALTYVNGSTLTLENLTIKSVADTGYNHGLAHATSVVYNGCLIEGSWGLFSESEFNNCEFNVEGDWYNVWTWGAPTAKFTGCTFNCDGKAMLLYSTVDTKLTMNGCTFNDNGKLTDLKAAIEIGNDYEKSYELIVNNAIVNGFEINDKGINTGTTLWANKNSMGTDKLNVVIDGVDVY